MAFDGTAIANIRHELQEIISGRIDKIYQPEKDEITIMVRARGKNQKLMLTANASHPRIHFTNIQKPNPVQAPMFCMVLRKHLAGGKIIQITQPKYERILILHIESSTEMGDKTVKQLIIEIMGKHSNIILTEENGVILDSIKHISFDKSSVREVLPGRQYVLPPAGEKADPRTCTQSALEQNLQAKSTLLLQKALYMSLNGISPVMASEIMLRAGLEPSLYVAQLPPEGYEKIYRTLQNIMDAVETGKFAPAIIMENKNIKDFQSIEMQLYQGDAYEVKPYESISTLLDDYFKWKDITYRSKQKSQDLKKIVHNNIERCVKKKDILEKTRKDNQNKDRLKLYGELLTANIYAVKQGMTSFQAKNFYQENEDIEIPLDSSLTAVENAQRYFKKYAKSKRTLAALEIQEKQNNEELSYLEGISHAIDHVATAEEIQEIRDELADSGYMKKRKTGKKQKLTHSKPFLFHTEEGIQIFVGKNNKQNDELTLKQAAGHDLWLHTKNIPGSHVIIKTDGKEMDENTILFAAKLAAYFSKSQNGSNVPVDYCLRKNVKKPSGAKPGMVIYDHYNTVYVTPEKEVVEGLLQQQ